MNNNGSTPNSLIKLDEATQFLAEAHRIDDVKGLRDKAEAMRVYAQQAKLGLEAQNYAAEIKLRAERRAGELLREMPKNEGTAGQGRPSLGTPAEVAPKKDETPTLFDLGISYNQSSSWQQLASLPEEKFEAQIAAVKDAGNELTTTGMLREAQRGHGVPKALQMSESNEWYTPSEYIEAARRVMGAIDLDPASCEYANQTVQAVRYLTLEDDGLAQQWHGRVWLNPPYGKDEENESNQGVWSARLIKEYCDGGVDEAIMLVNAVTDRLWFAPLWDFAICFAYQRVKFNNQEGKKPNPTHGNVFVYFGMNFDGFAREFNPFGRIVLPHGTLSEVWYGR